MAVSPTASPTPILHRNAPGAASPLVSIVMVSRGRAQYLRKALASVAAQTYPNIELIVIVDSSESTLPQIIEATLAEIGRDIRVAVTPQDNAAPGATLNKALDQARGAIVQFLTGDSTYLPDKTARTAEALGKAAPGVAAVYCDGYFVDERSRRRIGFSKRNPVPLGRNIHREMLLVNWLPSSGMLYRREVLTSLGGFDPDLEARDWDLLLRLTRHHDIVRIPDKLFLARLPSDGENGPMDMTQDATGALAKKHDDLGARLRIDRDFRANPMRALFRHRADLDLVIRALSRRFYTARDIQGENVLGATRSLLALLLGRASMRSRAAWFRLRGLPLGPGCKVGKRLVLRGHSGNLKIGAGVIFEGEAEFILPRGKGQGRVSIGDGCVIAHGAVIHCMAGDLDVEASSYVGRNVVVQSNGDLRIGTGTLIAANAGLYASNHVTADKHRPIISQGNSFRGITIGENSWIAHGAVVTDGTDLGAGSIVGPNVVVRGVHGPRSRLI